MNIIFKLPKDLERNIIKEYLGERISLSTLKCVSKYFSYISYHKTNHVKCNNCGWYIKNFPKNHNCNVPNCMLIKYIYKRNIYSGGHSHGCSDGSILT